jgi:hypothetical protein
MACTTGHGEYMRKPRIASRVGHAHTRASSILACRSSVSSTNIQKFSYLVNLEIDFDLEHQGSLHKRVNTLIKTLPRTLVSLKLSCLPRIDLHLLDAIATSLPALKTLGASCTERLDWTGCWGCLEESTQLVVHSSIPYDYASTDELAASELVARASVATENSS